MQTSKTRSGSSGMPQKTSPITPRSTRQNKKAGSESDSTPTYPTARTPTDRSPKIIDRRSPRSPAPEKKRISKVTELESQLTQAQEDLKKVKDHLSSSDSWKRRFQLEAEEAKKQLSAMTAKLEGSHRQLLELSASEEARVQELRKLSQERDRAWQSELEAVQQQHSVDSAALTTAMNEIQRLKLQFEMVVESEAAHSKQAEIAQSELQSSKQDMAETLSLVETLKAKLSDCEKSEDEYQALVNETQIRLEVEEATVKTLRSDGLKVMESFSSMAAELEVSKGHVNSLEELVRKLQADKSVMDGSVPLPDPDGNERPQSTEFSLLQSEVEQLKSALEAAEGRYQEEQVMSTMQLRTAYELVEKIRNEHHMKEAELELSQKEVLAEIVELKARLMDKETELQSISDLNERLNEEIQKFQAAPTKSESESELKKLLADVADLKANLMDKETELQSISEENELVKLEMENREAEVHKSNESAKAEVEVARAAEQEAVTRLGFVTEEADKNSRRAARVAEQLEAARATNSEMEAELRRLRIQSEQWRKAAEAAAAILTTGNNGGRLMERSGSMDSDYNSLAGKLMSSPYSDDVDDESPKKKNNNVLRRFGVLWKKGQK